MKKVLSILLANLAVCGVSAMPAAYCISEPPQQGVAPEDSAWMILPETVQQSAMRLSEAVDATAPFTDFDTMPLDPKRAAIRKFASYLRKVVQEEYDNYPEQSIGADAPDTTCLCFEKGSDIDWERLRVPSEGLDTQPLIDDHIAAFSQAGPFYLECPGYDLWERMDTEKHREELFLRFFDAEGPRILGCILRDGKFVDMQDFDAVQEWEFANEHHNRINSVRLQFTFADPGKIRMIALDTLSNRASIGKLEFTLQPNGSNGVQLTIGEKYDPERGVSEERFIEAVNTRADGRKSSDPDWMIRFPKPRTSRQQLLSILDTLDECIDRSSTASEEDMHPLLERIANSVSRSGNTGSKQIRLYEESQGRIEIYYVGPSPIREIVFTKALERQE